MVKGAGLSFLSASFVSSVPDDEQFSSIIHHRGTEDIKKAQRSCRTGRMTRLRFTNLLILLLVLALPCSGCVRRENPCTFLPATNSTAPEIPDGFGVNIDFTDPQPGDLKMLSEAGLRWVRMDLKWDAT